MLIISNKPGQLGNRLWVYAHLIAYAIEHNLKIYNPAFDEYAPLFEGTKKGIIPSFPPSNSRLSSKSLLHKIYKITNYSSRASNKLKINNIIIRSCFLDWEDSLDLDQNQIKNNSFITFINGWLFRCEGLLEKHQEMVRDYFTPVKQHKENVTAFVHQKRKKGSFLIGLHIRRGDYKNFEGGKYYYEVAYYNEILNEIQNHLKTENIHFIVCSNENITTKDLTVKNWSNGPGHYLEDMLTLAECDIILGPPSTFSLWAAFYGGKELFQIDSDDYKIITKKLNSLFKTSELTSPLK